MLNEANGLPVSGGLMVAIILYVLASMFVTGQVVGERMIAKSNWGQQCQTVLQVELRAQTPAPAFTPRLDCNSIFGVFGPQGRALCRRHGDVLKIPFVDQLQGLQRRKQELQEKRFALAASKTGSRCGCAVSLTLEQQRVPLAIYAGSIRLVTPRFIKNLNTELMSSLRSPHCAMKG